MLQLIFKNLWNMRGRYAWLFLELIIITGITWFIIDRTVVSLSDKYLPLGYDSGRLVRVAIGTLPTDHPGYAQTDSATNADNAYSLIAKLRRIEGVEYASGNSDYINSTNSINTGYKTDSPSDSIPKSVMAFEYVPGQEFFETYGIQVVDGSHSAEELSARQPPLGKNEIIITESYAKRMWHDGKAVGRKLKAPHSDDDDVSTVVAVVTDLRAKSYYRSKDLVFRPKATFIKNSFEVIVRLKPGTDQAKWARELRSRYSDLRTGNFYVMSSTPFDNLIERTEYFQGITAERNANFILVGFFLINLILGVTGSFYLQTRRRIEEMGIHRSFGARRGNITGILIGEGLALTTVACIAGNLLYLQYALKFGLSTGYSSSYNNTPDGSWVSNFGEHFAIISIIIYILLIICVVIGTYMPARSISRINPVDALRDE